MNDERVCQHCSKPMPRLAHGLKKYCSDQCGAAARKARGAVPAERNCVVCGRHYVAVSSSQRLCSDECRKADYAAKRVGASEKRKCDCCGKTFTSSWPQARYCSDECRKNADASRRRKPPTSGPCRVCGTVFNTRKPGGGPALVYCSSECRAVGTRGIDRASYARLNKRKCMDCGVELPGASKRMRCDVCRKERALVVSRAANRRLSAKKRAEREARVPVSGGGGPSYNVRERDKNWVRPKSDDFEKFISVVPSGNPLPSDPRAALVEALRRFPDFAQAFGEHHKIVKVKW